MNYKSLLVALMFAVLAVPALAQEAPRGRRGPGGFQGRAETGPDPSGERAVPDGFQQRPDACPTERVRQGGGNPLERLQETLGLTEAQVVAIEALQTARQETLQGLNASQREARQNVQDLIEQGASATDIGNAVLAASAIRAQIQAANEQSRTDFNNVLTLAQQELLAEIREAAVQARGLDEFLDPSRRGGRGQRGRRPGPEG